MFVAGANSDLMVARVEVELGEIFGFAEAIVEVIDT